MPKLCDIVKPGVPCKVKRLNFAGTISHGKDYFDGVRLTDQQSWSISALLDDDWQLDEPTVESVLRERRIVVVSQHDEHGCTSFRLLKNGGRTSVIFEKDDFLSLTVAQVNEICDLLDKYK